MTALAAAGLRVVLYEGNGSSTLGSEQRIDIMSSLLEAGFQVTRTVHGGTVTPGDTTDLLVLGQFEDNPPPTRTDETTGASVQFYDIGIQNGEAAVDTVGRFAKEANVESPGEWKPWFPVIDYDRCTNCMQCLSFCLFDVYSVDGEAQIKVQNQNNCKTNCPACSRVCPEAAIMFPKYRQSPINGAEVSEEDLQRESMKVDISALLGGDIYAALRSRQKDARERFSTERDESRALLERKRCLKKLQKDFDIPEEVLMSLPSAGDIEERAKRAKEKLAKRMKRSQTVQDQKKPLPNEQDWGI